MGNIPVEWAPVITKAWLDEEFKELLERDPATAFSQLGLTYDSSEPFTVPDIPGDLKISHFHVGVSDFEVADAITCTTSKISFVSGVDAQVYQNQKKKVFSRNSLLEITFNSLILDVNHEYPPPSP